MDQRPITRWSDRWIHYGLLAGPVIGFCISRLFTMGTMYQVLKDDHEKTLMLISWKDKQEDFNKVVIGQIAQLQEQGKNIRVR